MQKKLSNLTRILLDRAYPLHLIIKNIDHFLSQQTPQTETNIHSPHCDSFLRHCQTNHNNYPQKLAQCCQ